MEKRERQRGGEREVCSLSNDFISIFIAYSLLYSSLSHVYSPTFSIIIYSCLSRMILTLSSFLSFLPLCSSFTFLLILLLILLIFFFFFRLLFFFPFFCMVFFYFFLLLCLFAFFFSFSSSFSGLELWII